MIILALDALDENSVKKYDCKNLMQLEFGKTDISNFNLERTIVLWASFLTGRNMEKEIPLKNQWNFKLQKKETFLRFFDSFKTIDMPAFSFKKTHEKERRLLKDYFHGTTNIEEYEKVVWKIHRRNKEEFFRSLGEFDLIVGYFNLADAIGHLSFGVEEKMKKIYDELDNLAKKIKNEWVLIVSDHGMKAIGRYGDHTKNGFYSSNKELGLSLPRITDFYETIKRKSRFTH